MHAAYTVALLLALLLALAATACSATHARVPAQEAACCGGGTNAIRARVCVTGGGVLLSCPHGKYKVNEPDTLLHVSDDGSLHVGEGQRAFDIEPGQYCTARFLGNASDKIGVQGAIICFEDQTSGADYTLSGTLAIVSVIFLLLTLAAYAVLPQLRDLQGKCIMCMCGSMATGFLHLSIVQLGPSQQYIACAVHGFMTYFWMLATFFWMNVVSVNVWMSVAKRNKKISEDRQFVVYSLYAWGSSASLLIATLLTNYVEGGHIKPGIGESSCWFKGNLETWVYFYGPVAILIASNIFLFVVTSIQLWRKTNSLHVSNLQILKFRFRLYFKLFLITGISWIFELASFAHGQKMWLWVITDVINCLQGLIIFLILVAFRKRALRGLATSGYLGCLAGPALRTCAAGEDEECEEMVNEEELEQTTPAV